MKKQIVYIGGFELPDKNAAAQRVISNAKLFNSLGYNVKFIGITHDEGNIDCKIENKQFYKRKYPITKIEWLKYLVSSKEIIDILSNIDNIDFVICYNLQSIPLLKIISYCRKNRIKVISDCTEWYTTKGASISFKILKGLDSFIRMRIAQKKCDGIICISKYLEEYYHKQNTILLPPLVDMNDRKWKLEKKALCNAKNEDSLIFTFAGTLGRNKDDLNSIIHFINKINKEYNPRLVVIGITKTDYINKYKKTDMLDDNMISFLGRKNHSETLEILKQTDFSIFLREDNLSNKAGFPTKFVESYTLGIPVITNLKDDLDRYICDGENGFFINNEMSKQEINSFICNYINHNNTTISNLETFHYKNYETLFKEFINKMNR